MSRLDGWEYEVTEEHSRLGKMRVRMAGFQDVPMFDDHDVDHGPCQAVIAEEYDMQGRRLPERPRFHYVTRRRWAVENQGFWVLTKRWNLDTLAARNLNAIRARLNFALQQRLSLMRSTLRLFEMLFTIRCTDMDFGGNERLFPRGARATEAEQVRLVEAPGTTTAGT